MSLLGPDRVMVGQVVVDRADAKCIHCGDPFKFGVNVFTREGMKEVAISGMCERCFDVICAEPEEDEDAGPYCTCDIEPTIEEGDWGVCHCCGKPLS